MERNITLDLLKILMAFMVVGLHSGFLKDVSMLGYHLTVQGVFRLAVPAFFVISGFYFYGAVVKNNHKTWIKRILILYAVWMTFYSYIWLRPSDYSFWNIIEIIRTVFFGYYHLWYLPGLLGAALLMICTKNLPLKILVPLALTCFLTGVGLQYLGNYHYFEGHTLDTFLNKNWIHRNALFFGYPFFVIGFLAKKHALHVKLPLRGLMMLSIIALVCLLAESVFNFYLGGSHGGIDNFLTLIIAAPSIVLLCMKKDIKGVSKDIALYANGIYFIHPFILRVIHSHSELENTLLAIATIFVSVCTTRLLIYVNKRINILL